MKLNTVLESALRWRGALLPECRTLVNGILLLLLRVGLRCMLIWLKNWWQLVMRWLSTVCELDGYVVTALFS